MKEIREGMFVLYVGRVCIVDYADEYGAFLKDIDNDEMIMVPSGDYDRVKEY